MVKLVPATVNVAVRAAPVLTATANVTVPLPLPDAPAVIVIKVALLVAVHAHPVPAVTGTDPVPAAAPNAEAVIAPTVTVHDGAGVVVLAFRSFEQVTLTSNNAVAAKRRLAGNDIQTSRT